MAVRPDPDGQRHEESGEGVAQHGEADQARTLCDLVEQDRDVTRGGRTRRAEPDRHRGEAREERQAAPARRYPVDAFPESKPRTAGGPGG